MSWNIYLKAQTGANAYCYPYEDNYTYNVAPMYYKSLGDEGLRGLDGMLAENAIEKLQSAIVHMQMYPEEYKALNPPNGWGDYDGALGVLINLKNACQEHQFCIIQIS